jgi:hypothetical protein
MPKESQGIITYWSTTSVTATAAANVVSEVLSFSGPAPSANIIDVTNLQSTAKEKMIGLYDGGQITINTNFLVTDAGQTKMRECLAGRVQGNLMLQLSTVSTSQYMAMMGYVTGFNVAGAVDNVLRADYTITITKGVTYST